MALGADPGSATLMHAEASESAAAVQRMLRANAGLVRNLGERLQSLKPGAVVTVARGSSDNACTYGRYLIENRLGLVCASAGLSLGSIYHAPAAAEPGVCIAVSQSGASPDLLEAVRRIKRSGGPVLGLINSPASPLAQLCDEVVLLQAAPERSVAATKSLVASLAALAWIVAEWAQDKALLEAVMGLPDRLSEAWNLDWQPLNAALRHARNLYVLGRGPGLGIAQEAALKLKETCGLHAEAFSAAEVLHGPMALVGDGFPILAFAQGDETQATSMEVAERLSAMGGTVLLAGASAPGVRVLPSCRAHAAIEPILMIQSFYRAAANLSVERGFDPDRPPNLAKVTRSR